MNDRPTLEGLLQEANEATEGVFACPCCGTTYAHAFAIVDVSDIDALEHDAACGNCVAKALAASKPKELPSPDGWDSGKGWDMKAQRRRLLAGCDWVIAPDSPVDDKARKAYLAYRFALNNMTVDADGPESFSFPQAPKLSYMNKKQAVRRLKKLTQE